MQEENQKALELCVYFSFLCTSSPSRASVTVALVQMLVYYNDTTLSSNSMAILDLNYWVPTRVEKTPSQCRG